MTHRRRLVGVLKARAAAARRHLNQLAAVRVIRNPRVIIDDLIYRIDELDGQASRAINRRIQSLRERLNATASRTDALSPLAVLGRGYSVTSEAEGGRVITSASEAATGMLIRTRLAAGHCSVAWNRSKSTSWPKGARKRVGVSDQPNNSSSAEATADECSFEDSLAALEQVVHDLEDGNLGLTQSLDRYETGVKHLKRCYRLLESAERRIELLTG